MITVVYVNRRYRVAEFAVRSERTPLGISVAVGAIAVVAAAFVASAVPGSDPGVRFAVLAVTVGLFAAATDDHVALGPVALIAFLVGNGFLEDRFGQLRWHGSEDLWRLLLLVMAGALGLALGDAVRSVRALRERWRTAAPQAVTPPSEKE